MKIKLQQLRRIIREEIENQGYNRNMENKFQTIRYRIMTRDEVFERAQELNLDEKTTKYLMKDFDRILEDDDIDLDADIGTHGRISCGQSWEDSWNKLCIVMTGDDVWPDDEHPHVDKVWDSFYEE